MAKDDPTNFQPWMMRLTGILSAAAILAAFTGWGQDLKRDERTDRLVKTVDQHSQELRLLRDSKLRTEGHLSRLDEHMERYDEKLERLTVALERLAGQR